MNAEEAYKLGVEEAGDSFTTSFDVHTEEGALLMEAYENGRNDGEKALEEEEEVLEGFEKILSEVPSNLGGYVDEEAFKAFYDNQPSYWDDNTDEFWQEFEDSYQGAWGDDESFAQEMAWQLGDITGGETWPNNCIDWKQAGRELMHDYFESEGYYFRNL